MLLSMTREFTVRHRVAFSETDMAGIVHFSNYFRYMELAEDAFFRHLGADLVSRREGEVLGWPRVRASCDFKAPLAFGDEVEIALTVAEIKVRAVEFGFTLYKLENGSRGERVARGRLTTVHVRRRTGQTVAEMEALAVPAELEAALNDWVQ